jgi:hypothetical protein
VTDRRPLQESLDALRAEVQRVAASHPEDKERLERLFADLERASRASGGGPSSVTLRVREAVLHLEVLHPRLTAIVNDVLDSLGNVGM